VTDPDAANPGAADPRAADRGATRTADGGLRTLILLRHGKSDYPGGARDFDRPLADRGEAEATVAGRWLRSTQPPIDAVICSAALRTRQTLAATGIVAPVRYAQQLYDASPGELLAEIQTVSPDARTLLVIGHAPGIPAIAKQLAGDNSDSKALAEMSSKFPTSAMAVLRFDRDWTDLGPGGAALSGFHVARAEHDRDHSS
jgi:phosphohistidine phosphatase